MGHVTVSGRHGLRAPPSGVFRVKKPNGTVYWYYQARRGKPDQGPIIRMPDFGSPAFDREYDRLTRPAGPSTKSSKHDVSALVETYKAQPSWAAKSRNTIVTYGAALEHILEAWASRRVDGIRISHVILLINKFADRPSMGNMVRVQIKQLMKLAVQKGLRSDNPAREIDKLSEVGDGAQPIDVAAWAALMSDAAPTELRRLAVLGRATGQRISDLIGMRPCDRDEDGISTSITKLKGKPHWCPLRPDEIGVIDGWQQSDDATYLMKPNGRPYTEDSLRLVWNNYRSTDDGAALKGFTPHDLRATKVCDERIAGKTHQQIAAMVGMSMAMVMKYSRRIDQRLVARGSVGTGRADGGDTQFPQTIVLRGVAAELSRFRLMTRDTLQERLEANACLTAIEAAVSGLLQSSEVRP
jgi:integrase